MAEIVLKYCIFDISIHSGVLSELVTRQKCGPASDSGAILFFEKKHYVYSMKKILKILLIGAMCSFLMGVVSESPPQNGEPLGISKMIEDLSQPVTLTAESYFCSNAPVYLSQYRTLGCPHDQQAMRYATVLNTKCKNIQLPAVERFNLRC